MPPDHKVLAFDTSAAHCAVALLVGQQIVASRYEEMVKGQAERLMPLLEEVLADTGAAWSDLSRIGVGTGPGNFTGIRISVAAARGLALSLGIPAIGVTGFEAVAAQFGENPMLISLPAPREMAYVQLIEDGETVGSPEQIDPTTYACAPGIPVFGHRAQQFAGPDDSALRDIDPETFATNIARIAAARPPGERPRPLYVRAPDAAPARDTGPKMLA